MTLTTEHRDLVMKLFLRPFSPYQLTQVGQLTVAGEIECALSTG